MPPIPAPGAAGEPNYLEPSGIDDYLIFHLHRAARAATAGIDLHLRRTVGIGRREWRVLAYLADRPGVRLADFAESAGLDKVIASRILTALVARGVVERSRQSGDRRAVSLRLTERGEALYQAALAASARYNAELAAGMTPAQAAALQQVLPALRERAAAMLAAERAHEPGDAAAASAKPAVPASGLEALWRSDPGRLA